MSGDAGDSGRRSPIAARQAAGRVSGTACNENRHRPPAQFCRPRRRACVWRLHASCRLPTIGARPARMSAIKVRSMRLSRRRSRAPTRDSPSRRSPASRPMLLSTLDAAIDQARRRTRNLDDRPGRRSDGDLSRQGLPLGDRRQRSGTLLVYVWDVLDTGGKRLHRISGQETGGGGSEPIRGPASARDADRRRRPRDHRRARRLGRG